MAAVPMSGAITAAAIACPPGAFAAALALGAAIAVYGVITLATGEEVKDPGVELH